ncbi:lipoprotein intramolecular transacylase Lit [Teredinibacter purpureus]|nr:DUF1461 domain-containing protein [Teredinibacter purpureus]
MAKRPSTKSKSPKPAVNQKKRPAQQWRTRLGLHVQALSFGLLTLIVAFTVSWVVLAKYDFMYGVWLDHGGIGQGIDTYGPQNRYKTGFGDTTRDERIRVFSEINSSVHRGGEGLADITYTSPSSDGVHVLLRSPEVIHLQDVANLIDVLFGVAFISVILWCGVSGYLLLVERSMPSLKQQSMAVLALTVPAIVLVLILGPTDVFNQFHIWIFPAGHEWFFYYQDSLMSTLMLAPTLFGWIAIALLVAAAVSFVVIQGVLQVAATTVPRLLTRK